MTRRGVLFLMGALLLSQVHAAESEVLELPSQLRDSLPEFLVRDIRDDLIPFSKSTLKEMSKGYDRVAIVYYATFYVHQNFQQEFLPLHQSPSDAQTHRNHQLLVHRLWN